MLPFFSYGGWNASNVTEEGREPLGHHVSVDVGQLREKVTKFVQ